MNIEQESTGTLSSLLRIRVTPEDYRERMEQSLNELARKVQLKGFRPGKVPKGLVRKMYGNQVLAEELDKLVRQELGQYLQDKELRILGQPLPDEDSVTIDGNEPGEYEFRYELGLSPDVPLDALSSATEVARPVVTVSDAMVDEEWDRLVRQQGTLSVVDEVEAGDLVKGKFVELDEAGEIRPGGLFHESLINQDMVTDPGLAQELIGAKVGDTVVFPDLAAALDRTQESVVRYLLGAKDADPSAVGRSFRLEITEIKRNVPAAVDQAFLDKIFGEGAVADEAAAREVIRTEIGKAYAQQADRLLNDRIVEAFLDATELPLPEDFLQRWLLREKRNEAKEGEQAPEALDQEEFGYFRRNLKWSLIYQEIARNRSLTVEREELEATVRADVQRHYGPAFANLPEEDVNGLVGRLLGDREYLEKVHGNLMDRKVFAAIHETITIRDEAMDRDAFRALMSAPAGAPVNG